MAMDRYAKLELQIRTSFRDFWRAKLTKGRSKPILLPGFDIPRGETVDLFLHPDKGTTLCLVQRSDYVTVYKHTVGQLVGVLTHYQGMDDRMLREAVRNSKAHNDLKDVKQPKINVLKLSQRLAEERAKGLITLVLVTDLPEVGQQAKELLANFEPVASLMGAWLTSAVKRKKLCRSLDFYSVQMPGGPDQEAKVVPMLKGLKKLADSVV